MSFHSLRNVITYTISQTKFDVEFHLLKYLPRSLKEMSSNRHRRTRIYGINYDLGERYYKKQLEDLDNKSEYRKPRDVHFDTELPTKDDITSKVSLLPKDDCGNCFSNNKISGIFKDYDINFENDTSSLLPKKTFLDLNDDDTDALLAQMKQKRAMRKPIFEESDDDIAPIFPKKKTVSLRCNDDDDDDDLLLLKPSLKIKDRLSSTTEKKSSIANSVERKRITTRALISEEQSKEELEASNRARATKARLLDLESEMVAINKKNNEREKRKENLRKLLTSSGSDVNM
ncbi:uncharacterized protein ACN427_004999 isoform 1-T1 [Glossina fuscipes fuscipes]